MDSEILPTDFKRATIITLFKKASPSSSGNYGPISITSIPCKMLESIIREIVC